MNNLTKILAGTCLVILLAVAGTWYLWQGDRRAVLSTESVERQEQLEALLAGNGVDFEHDELNRVTVMSEDLLLARALADQASLTLPQRSGFEIFEDEDYGATEFVQRINYQRALQAELERTMIRIVGIRNARVHILQPVRSTFFKRDNVSRASVVLELERGVRLAAVAPSIAEILLGAIDGLEIEDVKIISGRGDVVAASDTASGNRFSAQAPAELVEQRLTETIYRVLSPLYDRASVGVSVSVELDRATRTLHRQNAPAGFADESVSDSALSDTSGVVTEDVLLPPGELVRIGVGVMLPHPTSDAEILQIEDLLRSGLGMSDERGDVLSVMAYNGGDMAQPFQASAIVLPDTEPPLVAATVLSDVVPLSRQQFNVVLLVSATTLGFLLLVSGLARRRQRRRIVGQVSNWLQEAAHE